jgi:hypothetical protein
VQYSGLILAETRRALSKPLAHRTVPFCPVPSRSCSCERGGTAELGWVGLQSSLRLACGLREGRPIWNQRAVKGEILMENISTAELRLCRNSFNFASYCDGSQRPDNYCRTVGCVGNGLEGSVLGVAKRYPEHVWKDRDVPSGRLPRRLSQGQVTQ